MPVLNDADDIKMADRQAAAAYLGDMKVWEPGLEWKARRAFAGGKVGGIYSVQDLSSLFQDSKGTTPAIVGQPVGLYLDRRLGLARGDELIANGTFDVNINGWVSAGDSPGAVVEWVSPGAMHLHNPGGGSVRANHEAGLVIGKWYEATFDLSNFTIGSIQFMNGGTTMLQTSAAGSHRAIFEAISGQVGFLRNFPVDVVVDNVSIRELPGNHLYQNTTSLKPTLRQDANGYYYLDPDGFDDVAWTSAIHTLGVPCYLACAIDRTAIGAADTFLSLSVNGNNHQTLGGTTGDRGRVLLRHGALGQIIVEATVLTVGRHVLDGLSIAGTTEVGIDGGVDMTGANAWTTETVAGARLFFGSSTGGAASPHRHYGAVMLMGVPTAERRAYIAQYLASLSGLSL